MKKITLNLEKDLLFDLCMMAHDLDITLNQLINKILKNYIDELESKKEINDK